MDTPEIVTIIATGAAAIAATVLQIAKKKTETPEVAPPPEAQAAMRLYDSFTKKAHDELCDLKMIPITQELQTIREHEKDAKETVSEVKETIAKIWDRVDKMIDEMHDNHIEVMKALK